MSFGEPDLSKASTRSTSIVFATVLVAVGTILPALCTINESFWIDELHTEWVILGPWTELHGRAASGNQTVLYFALMKLLANPVAASGWTTPEFAIRMLSAIAWGAGFAIGAKCLLFVSFRGVSYQPLRFWVSIGVLALWGLLDWVSWFHAIEARPYAFGLLLSAILIATTRREVDQVARPVNLTWMLAASASVWIHPVTGLVVIASWIGRLLQSLFLRDAGLTVARICLRHGVEGVIVSASWLPLVSGGLDLYSNRGQWGSFAGDSSLLHLAQNYPLGPWLFIPSIGFLLMRSGKKREQARREDRVENSIGKWNCFALQLTLIVLFPIGFAWLSTLMGWLPLMHRRYLLGSHLAMFLLGGMMLMRIRWTWGLVSVGLLSASLLVLQQGTWRHWENGEWMGWQRLEGWDEAIEYLNRHARKDDCIYLAPMLIETTKLPFAESHHPSYFEFPVRSAYRLDAPCDVIVVSNSAIDWSRTMSRETEGQGWLLVRTGQTRLNQWIKSMEGRFPFWKTKVRERLDFGRVQLLRIDR